MDISACYSLGAQYLQGLVTGFVLGYIFTKLYGSRENVCVSVESSDVKSSDVKRALGDILNEEEIATSSEPDKNTIIIRLTDSSLLNLLSTHIPRENTTEGPNEYEVIFNEVAAENRSDVSDTPSETKQFGGAFGYRPLDDFTPARPKVTDPTLLSRTEERRILDGLKHIVGMPLNEAEAEVAAENMSIHVLYVGMGPKMPLPAYSSTTIGVRVKKAEEGLYDGGSVITELIDVGGIDARDYGVIKL